MTRHCIVFREVSFCYHRRRLVIKDLSLAFNTGQITAILGPNGVGKTTLIFLALGWFRPQQGTVTLNEKPVWSYSNRERGKWMSLVPQKEHIPFEYSLLEYVLLGRIPYLRALEMPDEEDYRCAREMLNTVGLGDLWDESVTNLSGGERQLLLIARSLVQNPRILLLDEPTAHLDLKNKQKILRLLRALSSGGISIVFTTHEPEIAFSCARHIVLMGEEGTVQTGLRDAMFREDLLSSVYGINVSVVEVRGQKSLFWL
jgi:iron complex transport system ATP-binding protein